MVSYFAYINKLYSFLIFQVFLWIDEQSLLVNLLFGKRNKNTLILWSNPVQGGLFTRPFLHLHWASREQRNPLEFSPDFPTNSLFSPIIGVAMTTLTFQLFCVSGHFSAPLSIKPTSKSGQVTTAFFTVIGWIICKQRMRSFETWVCGTRCLQQLVQPHWKMITYCVPNDKSARRHVALLFPPLRPFLDCLYRFFLTNPLH